MSVEARRRAERCFALARSTTFAGERKAAISRGTKIAEKAGLSLDLFDIPGRKRGPTPERLFEGNGIFGDNFRYVDLGTIIVEFDLGDLMSRLNEMELRGAAVAREREVRHQRKIDDALNFLWSRGVRIYRDGVDGFVSPDHHDPDTTLTDNDVLLAAKSRGWNSPR